MRRRGFHNTIVFEQDAEIGGKIHTLPNVQGFSREMGAAFLSPDYVEVRSLLTRFGQKAVPLEVQKMLRFHYGNNITSAGDWSNSWVGNITGTLNKTANGIAVGNALKRYFSLHKFIFGAYRGSIFDMHKYSIKLHID